MAKQIKKYNKEKERWEVIGNDGDVTIEVTSPSGLTDENIQVTNCNFHDSGSRVTLDDALDVISDDIERLKRNVSWLAAHGGGGGTGGGGTASYGIVLTSVRDGGEEEIITNNTIYLSETALTIKFRISGGTSSDIFQYRYLLDGNKLIDYKNARTDEIITVQINNIKQYSSSNNHVFVVEAINPYGMNVPQLNITFVLRSLKLELSSRNEINKNGEIVLPIGGQGYVYFDVTNGVINSDLILSTTCNGVTEHTDALKNTTTRPQEISINIWNIIKNATPGNSYLCETKAQATLGEYINTTLPIAYRIIARSADNMGVFLDSLTEYEKSQESEIKNFEADNILTYGFRAYVPNLVSNKTIYYAAKLTKPGQNPLVDNEDDELILGNYFNEHLYNPDIEIKSANSNPTTTDGLLVSPSLTTYGFSVSEGWKITIKVWDLSLNNTASTIGVFNIIAANNEYYSRQIPKRSALESNSLTLLSSWNYSNVGNGGLTWVSTQPNYSFTDGTGINSAVTKIECYGCDGINTGIIKPKDELPYLRLQNKSYAIADFSDYQNEIKWLTNGSYGNNSGDGFTLSITFKTDKSAYKDKTIFQFGSLNNQGELINGIKIDLGECRWVIKTERGEPIKLIAPLTSNNITTIDFVYGRFVTYVYNKTTQKEEKTIVFNAAIYIDGVLRAIQNVGAISTSVSDIYPNQMYIGCAFYNNLIQNFGNVTLYDLSLYTHSLNTVQCTINAKNAKILQRIENIEEYKEWKRRNLLSGERNYPICALYNGDSFQEDIDNISEFQENSVLPVVTIELSNSDTNPFTEDAFLKPYQDKSITNIKHPCNISYYEPSSKKGVNFSGTTAIQGTSTIGYRIKNLEIEITEPSSRGVDYPKLFQPIPEWFPEKEFTLKADMVDSSHANNATLGRWINQYGSIIMEDNPVQSLYKNNKSTLLPKDICNGKTYIHEDAKTKELIDYDENVTVKHTIEGFPIVLIIKFAESEKYKLIGIYSFNLGRYSYYNMGMKFLKSFSRRSNENPSVEVSCPAMIDSWEETQVLDDIKANEIFDYEFGSDADDNTFEHPTFSQYDESVIKHYGEFKYVPNGISEPWDKLCNNLFYHVASIKISNNPLFNETKEKYRFENNQYVSTKIPIDFITPDISELQEHLSLTNSAAYFIIANTFGMVDSLGKNMKLRSWDNGNKWWPAFYDMDTANGLTNTGTEDVSELALIDKIGNIGDSHILVDDYGDKIMSESGDEIKYTFDTINIEEAPIEKIVYQTDKPHCIKDKNGNKKWYRTTDPKGDGWIEVYEDEKLTYWYNPNIITYYVLDESINTVTILKNQNDKDFGLYSSKLWEILRDTTILYAFYGNRNIPYNTMWTTLRTTTNVLKSSDDFINLMKSQIGQCGEIIYNYDYDNKYVKQTDNLNMLHGTRISYVENWLRNRTYFLDGIFDDENAVESNFEDSPYHKKIVSITNAGHNGKPTVGYMPLTLRTTAPVIVNVATGVNGGKLSYFVDAYTDTQIRISEHTSLNKQTTLNNSTLITKIEGLGNISTQSISEANGDGVLETLNELNISGTEFLHSNPINSKVFINDGVSTLEKIDVSNTKFASTNTGDSIFKLDLEKLYRIESVNIFNSPVNSIAFSKYPISYLNINNSRIGGLKLESQTLLETISFNGCNNLTDIQIINCNFKRIEIPYLSKLNSVIINGCSNLEEVIIEGNENDKNDNLEMITITGNNNLKKISITNRNNRNLNIELSLYNCETLILNDIESVNNPKILIQNVGDSGATDFSKLKILDLKNYYNFETFNIENVEGMNTTYIDNDGIVCKVFDLSKFVNLTSINLSNDSKIKCMKVTNSFENPFKLSERTLLGLNELRRIFGCIEIGENFSFSGFNKFKLNEAASYKGREISFNDSEHEENWELLDYIEHSEDENFTHLKIKHENRYLDNLLSNTSCGIEDAYYILKRCENILSLSGTFSGCLNIAKSFWDYDGDQKVLNSTKKLNKDCFKYCKNVTNINRIFYNSGVAGYLHRDLFKPLHSLKSMNYVFSEMSITKITDFLYGIDENGIEIPQTVREITDFNPIPYRASIIGDFGYSVYFNKKRNEGGKDDNRLTEIKSKVPFFKKGFLNSFKNVTKIISCFNSIAVQFDNEMFKPLMQIELIYSSFKDLLLIGYDDVNHSFTYGSETRCVINNLFGITNNTLLNIGDSLSFVECLPSENSDFSYTIEPDYLNMSEIDERKQSISNNDTPLNRRLFVNLNDSFFDGVRFIKGIGIDYDIINSIIGYETTNENSILFNGNIKSYDVYDNFIDNYGVNKFIEGSSFPYNIINRLTDLKCICGLFNNLYISNRKNERLPINFENVVLPNNIFENLDSLTNVSYCFANMNVSFRLSNNGFSTNKNIKNLAYLFYNNSDSFIEISTRKQKIGGIIGKIPYRLFYNPNNTITNLTSCFQMCDGSEMLPYTCTSDEYNLYCQDFYDDTYKFNIYLYDGTENFFVEHEIEELEEGFLNDYPLNKYSVKSVQTLENYVTLYTEFKTDNYFCPPDIFKYCTSDAKIDNIFNLYRTIGLNQFGENGVIHGIYGRICPYIFKPLNNIISLNGVFNGCVALRPYKFAEIENGNVRTGSLYPPNLFNNLIKLKTVENMFANNIIWGGLYIIKSDVNETNNSLPSSLISASGLFSSCKALISYSIEGEIKYFMNNRDIFENIFENCINLINVSDLFNRFDNLYQFNENGLINYYNNPFVNNVSGFINLATLAQDRNYNLIKFWNNFTIISNTNCYTPNNLEYWRDQWETDVESYPSYFRQT